MMEVLWSPRAKQNLDEIFSYVRQRNPSAAVEVLDSVEDRVLQLKSYPDLGRPGRIIGTRELIITGTPYIAAYQVRQNQGFIDILALMHGARQWPEAFD
jgi:toxin ParE1/3/4